MTRLPCLASDKRIAAAFVALYDYALAGLAMEVPFDLIETIGYSLCCTIAISRAEAQALLNQPTGEINVAAALVLTYEGVGTHRAEADYCFCLADLLALDRVRRGIPLSLRGALAQLT